MWELFSGVTNYPLQLHRTQIVCHKRKQKNKRKNDEKAFYHGKLKKETFCKSIGLDNEKRAFFT